MLGSLVIAIFLLGLLAGGIALIFMRLSRYPNRSVVDVADFLRPGNPQKMMDLLNPQFEEGLRATLPRREFLRQQRKGLLSILEFLACMSHSTRICIELANNELQRETVQNPGRENDDDEDYIDCALALQQAAVEFRFYCLAARMKARTWLICRTQWWLPLDAPHLSQLRDLQGLSFTASYNRFVRALSDVGRIHGMEFQDSFLHALIK
ncbi:MAG TPA: hypothetical protein VNW97_14795 [Candidatus Saccharimonadales bacterium]|jgi:hypothetical protein|nr:hypothetical protein [Candidatus Saccharimonadales bacterium]